MTRRNRLVKELGAKSAFEEYTSGHDSLMWEVALAEYLPRVFPAKSGKTVGR